MSELDTLGIDPAELSASLADGWGVPTHLYRDPVALDLDHKAVWRKEWIYLCPTEKMENKGDVVTGYCGDVPIIVTRAEDGELRGFVNACRHRGYQVALEDKKKCRALVCGYHAWSYRLNGNLASAPGSDDECGFNKQEFSLLPISVETWGQAVFVNADPHAEPFTDHYPGVNDAAEQIGMILEPGQFTFYKETRHPAGANWKLWMDNFVECYHCDNIHGASFSAAYNSSIEDVETIFRDRYMFNRFPPRGNAVSAELQAENYRSINFYPGRVYLQQTDIMLISQMRPTGPETSEQVTHFFIEEGADPDRAEKWIDLWDQTFAEDCGAASIQQKVLRTGATTRNRLFGSREQAVVRFNGWVIDSYKNYKGIDPAKMAAE